MANDRIIIKGTSNGLIITLGAGNWPDLVQDLDLRLGEKASFFKGGRVALRVGARKLTPAELEEIGQTLDRHQVTLWAVESSSEDTYAAAAELGLEIEASDKPVPSQPEILINDALLVRRTLRSGQVIDHPGHVVVIGDVNPGAEIMAEGSVVIWGRLRGSVHAGKGPKGDEAVVCALTFKPTQLRIGNYLAFSPAEDEQLIPAPEMAFIHNYQIVAEPWENY
jgi:septum site-determining protein MinC